MKRNFYVPLEEMQDIVRAIPDLYAQLKPFNDGSSIYYRVLLQSMAAAYLTRDTYQFNSVCGDFLEALVTEARIRLERFGSESSVSRH